MRNELKSNIWFSVAEFKTYNLISYTELLASKKMSGLAMTIFEFSKFLIKEEKYSLTDQMKRSSRSIALENFELAKLKNYWVNNLGKFGVQ